jgi:hypothetical protein
MSKLLLPPDQITILNGINRRLDTTDHVWEYDPDDAPGALTGVVLKIRASEKHGNINYGASVVWNPIAPGTCQADILAYYIELRPCTVGGVEREAGRKKRRTFLVRKGTDLDADVLRVDFGKLQHARKWHYQARGRVIDKARRLGDWSAWTDPVLARNVSTPQPPVPTGVAIAGFDKNEKDRHEPRWRLEAECDEIGVWDVPPDDLATFERQRVRITKYDLVTGGNFTLTYGGQTTATIAHDASAATVKTRLEDLSNIANGDLNVSKPKAGVWEIDFVGISADPNELSGSAAGLNPAARNFLIETNTLFERGDDDPEPVTDVARYVFQIRRSNAAGTAWITYTRGAEEHFIQREKTKNARAEDRDNNNKVQCIFPNIRKRHSWKLRVRSVDIFGRRGDWSDWTLVGTASETDSPPGVKHPITGAAGFLVEIDPKRIRVTWDNDTDSDDPDADLKDPHLEISHAQIQVSDRSDFSKALSDLYKADRHVDGETKAFRKKRSQRGPFWVRVRNVNGSGKKSAWITQSGNQRKKPGKVRNKSGKKVGRRFEINFDEPNQWHDGTTAEWSVTEVSRYFVELRRSGSTVKSKYTKSTNPGFDLTAAEAKLTGYSCRVTALGWEDEEDGPDTDIAEGTTVPLDISYPDVEEGQLTASKMTMGDFRNLVDDPSFELHTDDILETWDLSGTAVISSSNARTGLRCLRFFTTASNPGGTALNRNFMSLSALDEVYVGLYASVPGTTTATIYSFVVRILCYDADFNLLAISHPAQSETIGQGNPYEPKQFAIQIPNNSAIRYGKVQIEHGSGVVHDDIVVDDVYARVVEPWIVQKFYGGFARKDSGQSLPDDTNTTINYNISTSSNDPYDLFQTVSSGTGGSAMVLPYEGMWDLRFNIQFAANNVGRRQAWFYNETQNETFGYVQEGSPTAGDPANLSMAVHHRVSIAGSVIRLRAFQNTGSPADVHGNGTDEQTRVSAEFKGRIGGGGVA